MNTSHPSNHNSDEDLNNDPIWDLLRQSPSVDASPAFADRVMRAVRMQEKPLSFWQKLWATPLWARSACGLGALAAAITFAVVLLPDPVPTSTVAQANTADVFADLDEVASQEMLLAATDHLNEFSDTELVSLIGF